MSSWRSKVAVAVLSGAAVTGGFFGGATLLDRVQFARAESQVDAGRADLAQVEDMSSVFRQVAKVVDPSVVRIDVSKTIHNQQSGDDDMIRKFFQEHGGGDAFPQIPDNGGDFEQRGTGSGVIMEVQDGYGYILTNNHVAGGASDDITVTLSNGRQIDHGRLIGADPKSDLAVVRIKADDLIPAQWGSSDDLQKGDWVLAFGCPFGYSGTMTHGIVSALNRDDVDLEGDGLQYENFIQTDAAINPGNSGGPLVNLHGEVVGINTAIASRSGGFQGIGFAIPSNEAKAVFSQLKDHHAIVRGWLGVEIEDVSFDQNSRNVARSFGYDKQDGILVTGLIPNTPAWGKLQSGDIVTAYNGRPMEDRDQLRRAVAATDPDTKATLTVFRDGKYQEVEVTIGKQPDNLDALARPGEETPGGDNLGNEQQYAAVLGLHLQTLDDDLAAKIGLASGTHGAVITSVDSNSIASKAGIGAGAVITQVFKTDVKSAHDAYEALGKADLKKGIRLSLLSKDGSTFVFLQSDDGAAQAN
jgi:serine protease Do